MREDRTLLDIARTNLFIARCTLEHIHDDEFVVNCAAFHVQQGIELALKHALETSGVAYKGTHDIASLLNQMDFTDVLPADILDTLELSADTITGMESKTRYIKNYLVSLRTVMRFLGLGDQLCECLAKRERSMSDIEFPRLELN